MMDNDNEIGMAITTEWHAFKAGHGVFSFLGPVLLKACASTNRLLALK